MVFSVERLERKKRGDRDVVGFGAVFEAELAGGVVAEREDTASVIEREGVVVTCCNLRDGKARQSG